MTTTNLYQLPTLRLIKYMQMRKYKYFSLSVCRALGKVAALGCRMNLV